MLVGGLWGEGEDGRGGIVGAGAQGAVVRQPAKQSNVAKSNASYAGEKGRGLAQDIGRPYRAVIESVVVPGRSIYPMHELIDTQIKDADAGLPISQQRRAECIAASVERREWLPRAPSRLT
jgi:hypothetical protein